MPLNPEPPKIIAGKNQKHPVATTSGEKSQITVVSCCNTGGYVIPPMVIFDRKVLKPELTLGVVPGTMYGLSRNGWIDSDLFEQWFLHHFLAYAPPVHPLLLIMNGILLILIPQPSIWQLSRRFFYLCCHCTQHI